MSRKEIPSHTKYICDRCHSTEEIYDENQVIETSPVLDIDLCKKCVAKLRSWVKAGASADIHEP